MTRNARSAEAAPADANPLFAVAMLRIALELKKPSAEPVDALVEKVVARMQLDGAAFRAFLERNLGLLRAAAPVKAPAVAASAPRRRTQRG
jgi:hypothetical protein